MFHLILEAYGWEDLENTEAQFEADQSMKPEAARVLRLSQVELEARYHAPVNMISLRIWGREEGELQAHFLYDHRPERIIEWIVQQARDFYPEKFEEQIKEARPYCEMILFEKSNTEIYEVRPGANV